MSGNDELKEPGKYAGFVASLPRRHQVDGPDEGTKKDVTQGHFGLALRLEDELKQLCEELVARGDDAEVKKPHKFPPQKVVGPTPVCSLYWNRQNFDFAFSKDRGFWYSRDFVDGWHTSGVVSHVDEAMAVVMKLISPGPDV